METLRKIKSFTSRAGLPGDRTHLALGRKASSPRRAQLLSRITILGPTIEQPSVRMRGINIPRRKAKEEEEKRGPTSKSFPRFGWQMHACATPQNSQALHAQRPLRWRRRAPLRPDRKDPWPFFPKKRSWWGVGVCLFALFCCKSHFFMTHSPALLGGSHRLWIGWVTC